MPLFEGMKDELIRQGWTEEQVQGYLWKLGRETALVGIMNALFLKRLESSIEALHIGIDRQIRFQEKFLDTGPSESSKPSYELASGTTSNGGKK